MRFSYLFVTAMILTGGVAHARIPHNVCASIHEVPLIKTIRTSLISLNQESTTLDSEIENLRNQCQSPASQTGDGLRAKQQAIQSTGAKAQEFRNKANDTSGKMGTAISASGGLGAEECRDELADSKRQLDALKDAYPQRIRDACGNVPGLEEPRRQAPRDAARPGQQPPGGRANPYAEQIRSSNYQGGGGVMNSQQMADCYANPSTCSREDFQRSQQAINNYIRTNNLPIAQIADDGIPGVQSANAWRHVMQHQALPQDQRAGYVTAMRGEMTAFSNPTNPNSNLYTGGTTVRNGLLVFPKRRVGLGDSFYIQDQ